MIKQQIFQSALRWAAPLVAATLVSACATIGAADEVTESYGSPEEAVQARSAKRWQHLLASEFDKAYTYLPPSSRAVTSEKAFIDSFSSSGGIEWLNADVVSAECPDEARCLVKIAITAEIKLPGFKGPTVTQVDETWIKEDGQWWFYRR